MAGGCWTIEGRFDTTTRNKTSFKKVSEVWAKFRNKKKARILPASSGGPIPMASYDP